jgi:Na+/melibiose symporter-like transporter
LKGKEENRMGENKKADKSTWAIGGTLLMGMGVGFFFLKENPLAFVACILIGLGLGLVITPIISKAKGQD